MKTTLAVKTIENKEMWNEACGNNLLQAWEWGEFQEKLGKKVWRIGIFEVSHNGKQEKADLKAIALGTLIKTKLRTHIYISNGPVFAQGEGFPAIEMYFQQILGYFKALALRENANFLRFDPLFTPSPESFELLKSLKTVKSGTHIQAECTWILDLQATEEELLKGMKKDNRYEIKKAQKEGVIIEKSNKVEDFERFWNLFEDTFKRQGFVPNTKEYYQDQFVTFSNSGKANLFFAKNKEDKDVASAIIFNQGDTAFYLHAASADSKVLELHFAPKLLLWEAILNAKKEGITQFDFFGIAKSDSPKDPWYGFTHFKKGFGGFKEEHISAYDFPLTPKYWLVQLIELTRGLWLLPYYSILKLFKKA
jgi:lipid II:glycine glycyltransferase (peptidoglycan interpeptide bridge formation enzyme)